MNVLTTPINVRNIMRLRAFNVVFDPDNPVATVVIQAINPLAASPYGVYSCTIVNGICQGVRANASPTAFNDCVEVFALNVATGYTDLVAAYAGATLAARLRGVETMMIAAGLMPAGTVS